MLIDKDKLIERIKYNFSPTENYSMQSLINAINDYSKGITVQWTPVSEELPKEEECEYMICTDTGYMCLCRWTNDVFGLGANEYSGWGWHIMDRPQYTEVVAWMFPPERYIEVK